MTFLHRYLTQLTAKPYAIIGLVLFGLCLHIGTTIKGGLYADDYVHASYFLGNEILAEKGFLDGIGVGEFRKLLADQFNFFDPSAENYQALMDFGVLPWWASQDALLHFFRPLAVVTHYIDYQLWPENTHIMHAVSLLWYGLGLFSIYLLYRGVGVEKSIAILALLLVILDHSIFQVVTWIASRSMLLVIAIGFFSVYAYHKSMESWRWYVVSFIALLLALLSAEGAVAICAYLGAYMFTLDRRCWSKRILHLLPFALLVILWRLYYQSQGYGAYGVDFYLDPGREPLEFLKVAVYRLPGNFFELASGIDIISGQIRQDIRHLFAIFGVLVFISLFWLVLPQLRRDRKLQFFLLASYLALIPGLAIALAPRVMILPNVGFAILLAYIAQAAFDGKYQGARKSYAKVVVAYIVIVHIFLSAVLATIVTIKMIKPEEKTENPRGYVDLGVTDYVDKRVVILNAQKPFWLAFAAHQLVKDGQQLPASLRVLASAFYPIEVTRVADYELLMVAHPGFQYDIEPLIDMSDKPIGHYIYLTQELMGLIRASRDEWHIGEEYTMPEMNIRVNALYKGKPSSLSIFLTNNDINEYRWVYWNTEEKKYQAINLPAVGKKILLEGLFNNDIQHTVLEKIN